MVRRPVFLSVGGYDETIRGDLEDWDFWLKCANAGYWGATIPEYLDWYRRRADHAEQRPNWKDPIDLPRKPCVLGTLNSGKVNLLILKGRNFQRKNACSAACRGRIYCKSANLDC